MRKLIASCILWRAAAEITQGQDSESPQQPRSKVFDQEQSGGEVAQFRTALMTSAGFATLELEVEKCFPGEIF